MSELRRTGIGTRVLNFIVDTLLAFLISYALFKWWMFYVRYWDKDFIPFYVFFYSTVFVYYFLLEGLLGRTPGKYLSMTKVVTVAGNKIHFGHAFLRSLLRLTLIDAFFILLWEKPLHDKLSNTEVVEV